MKLANKDEVDTAIKVARAWVAGHPMFAHSGPQLAVAEFSLNQKGLTMYEKVAAENA